jgi:hypothetical protein
VLILGLSIIGLPLAIPLVHFMGKFVTKPIFSDPRFKVDPSLEGYDDNSKWYEVEVFEGE